MGNKTKLLKPHVRQTILDYIAKGNYISTACMAAGVSHATYCNWVNRAEREEGGVYVEFLEELKRAEAKSEADTIARIHKAGQEPRNWAADMTRLERKNPSRWGRRMELEVGPSKVLLALQQQAKLEYIQTDELDTTKGDKLLLGEAP